MPALPKIDSRTLRHALGCFPTGVTVVTAVGADGALVGLTINSFNSLSLDPPLILWSLGTRSSSRRAFEASGHFAVNILAEDQEKLSRHFASKDGDLFEGIGYSDGASDNAYATSLRWDYVRYFSGKQFELYTRGELMRPFGSNADISVSGEVGGRYHINSWLSLYAKYARNLVSSSRESLNESIYATGLGISW